MSKVTIKKRVEAGAAFLNVVNPGWEKKIDLKILDLRDTRTCVIGELYGEYNDGIEKLGITGIRENGYGVAESLGFNAHGNEPRTAYTALTKAWKTLIKKLKR